MQAVSTPGAQFVGKTIGGYLIERFIGPGPMRAVYQARQGSQKSPVFFTIFLPPETLPMRLRERFIARFLQEGTELLQLKHPNILPLLHVGEQAGYPYLITPFMAGNSLAHVLKQSHRFTAHQTLEIIKPVAAALDYAHSKGSFHGTINPSNILLNRERGIQVASFGFTRLLALKGIAESTHPQVHLLNIAGTPLNALPYTAPEVIQGLPISAQADVFATGVMIFELLSGTLPFHDETALNRGTQANAQHSPSLRALNPEIPVALDLVVHQALAHDPKGRFQSVGRVVKAFERVLHILSADSSEAEKMNLMQDIKKIQTTMPPTVDWTTENIMKNKEWQLQPPITRQLPAMPSTGTLKTAQTEKRVAPQQMDFHPADSNEPFVWPAQISPTQTDKHPAGMFSDGTTDLHSHNMEQRKKPALQKRRNVLAMLAAGGLTVGVLGVSGVALARVLQRSSHPSQTAAIHSTAQTTTSNIGNTSAVTQTTQPQNTPSPQMTPTSQSATSPTRAPQPTAQPTQANKNPPSSQTVIGSTSQGTNTAKNFTNSGDNAPCTLIHLPNGNFVAYETICTHQGVPVTYNSGSHLLVCPAHGSVFDPAKGGQVVQGPANAPLRSLTIHINGDGSIIFTPVQ